MGWTPEEDRILKENYLASTVDGIMSLLPNKNLAVIRSRARHLHVALPVNKWTEAENEILRKNYPTMEKKHLMALLLSRTWQSIKVHSNKNLKLHRKREDLWTDDEIDILKKNYSTMPKEELMRLLSRRAWHSIWARAERWYGLGRPVVANFIEVKMKEMEEWQKAYIAGMIDGEGSILVTPQLNKNTYHFEIMISNTNVDALRAIKDFAGGIGKIYIDTKTPHKSAHWLTRRVAYKYRIFKKSELLPFIRAIKKYLIIKKSRAEIFQDMIIHLINSRKEHGSHRGYIHTAHTEQLYNMLKEENRRGVTMEERQDRLDKFTKNKEMVVFCSFREMYKSIGE